MSRCSITNFGVYHATDRPRRGRAGVGLHASSGSVAMWLRVAPISFNWEGRTSSMIRYEVEIVGHAPPFKWAVFRVGLDGIEYKVDSGENWENLAGALSEADDGARRDQFERKHRNTKVRALLFECDPEPSEVARKERDAKVVNFGLAARRDLREAA